MDWIWWFKVFLSCVIGFCGVFGSLYVFGIDRLKDYQKKEKRFRIVVGSSMFIFAILLCVVYKEYIKYWLPVGS